MRVRDWMSPDPVTVTRSTQVAEARHLMHRYGVRHLPVVDDDHRPVGIVSDRDVGINEEALQRALAAHRNLGPEAWGEITGATRHVAAVMSAPPFVIDAEEPVEAAAWLMLSQRISALPVVDEERRLLGLISTTDYVVASLSSVAETGAN